MANSRRELSESLPFACLHLPHLKASFGFDRFGPHDADGRSPRERACPQEHSEDKRASVCTSTREHCQPTRKYLLENTTLATCRPCAARPHPMHVTSKEFCSDILTFEECAKDDLWNSSEEGFRSLRSSTRTHFTHRASIARLKACAIDHNSCISLKPITHPKMSLETFRGGAPHFACQ